MTTDRITNPLRLTKLLVGAAAAVISIGMAAPAGASPVPQPPTPQDFLAAARAAGRARAHGRRASPERIRRCWKRATACAGDCGFGRCRLLRWPLAWCKTIHS